jgi:rubrerythrin
MIQVLVSDWTCKKCGHKWISRIQTKPKACPSCKAYRWDTEKKVKAVKA